MSNAPRYFTKKVGKSNPNLTRAILTPKTVESKVKLGRPKKVKPEPIDLEKVQEERYRKQQQKHVPFRVGKRTEREQEVESLKFVPASVRKFLVEKHKKEDEDKALKERVKIRAEKAVGALPAVAPVHGLLMTINQYFASSGASLANFKEFLGSRARKITSLVAELNKMTHEAIQDQMDAKLYSGFVCEPELTTFIKQVMLLKGSHLRPPGPMHGPPTPPPPRVPFRPIPVRPSPPVVLPPVSPVPIPVPHHFDTLDEFNASGSDIEILKQFLGSTRNDLRALITQLETMTSVEITDMAAERVDVDGITFPTNFMNFIDRVIADKQTRGAGLKIKRGKGRPKGSKNKKGVKGGGFVSDLVKKGLNLVVEGIKKDPVDFFKKAVNVGQQAVQHGTTAFEYGKKAHKFLKGGELSNSIVINKKLSKNQGEGLKIKRGRPVGSKNKKGVKGGGFVSDLVKKGLNLVVEGIKKDPVDFFKKAVNVGQQVVQHGTTAFEYGKKAHKFLTGGDLSTRRVINKRLNEKQTRKALSDMIKKAHSK